jgi:hypothetical protein
MSRQERQTAARPHAGITIRRRTFSMHVLQDGWPTTEEMKGMHTVHFHDAFQHATKAGAADF